MSHTRIRVAAAMVLSTALMACGDDPTSPIAGAGTPNDESRPQAFNEGCNGVNGSQFKVSSTRGSKQRKLNGAPSYGEVPQRLQQVIVYGNPVQRPNRGYGALESYGGATQTYFYDRYIIDECSFGPGYTFGDVGPVADDTLDSPDVAPDSIPQAVWSALTPRVRKQLREAAWYLAEHWIPNDLPGIGTITREARRALFFQALANGFDRAQEMRADRRRETEMFVQHDRTGSSGLSRYEVMRVDALLMGCSTIQSFRELQSWNAQQAEDWASRVVAAWASDATQDFTLRFLEPQLSRLGAIGAQLGRDGTSCAQAARYHFENRTTDLYDPSQDGSGGGSNPFLF